MSSYVIAYIAEDRAATDHIRRERLPYEQCYTRGCREVGTIVVIDDRDDECPPLCLCQGCALRVGDIARGRS